MEKCCQCTSKKADRKCIRYSSKYICSLCCGSSRSWDKCPTTCKYFKKEEGPQLYVFLPELMNENTGEGTRFIVNCYLPNIYQLITCIVHKLQYNFIDSHSIEISLQMHLEAPRDVCPELYLKDDWKKDENWGPYTEAKDLAPIFFLFGLNESTFSQASTHITIDGMETNTKQSLIHWNIWMPFSLMCVEKIKVHNPLTKRMDIKGVRTGSGKCFFGKNLAIFSKLALNVPIEIKTLMRYQKLPIVKGAKQISSMISIFLPYKKVQLNNVELIAPPSFSINEKTTLDALSPYEGKIQQSSLIPINEESEKRLIYNTKESIKLESYKITNIDNFKLICLNTLLDTSIDLEAIAFVTSFPIPLSIYDAIIQLHGQKVSPAKVVISNFSEKSCKVSIIAEIQGYSHIFEKDIIINPWSQSDLRIIPTLIDDKVKEIYNDLNTTISIKVYYNNEIILRVNNPIKLLSKNTMLWEIEDPGLSWRLKLANLITVWVTPNIPEIAKIISEAANEIGEIKGPLAYQYGDSAVEKEVKAIYDVISKKNIRYVNRPISFGIDENIATQRISTPKEVLTQKAGNCIDLSILFASCLESCGIKPLIVLIPKHAFVGWKGNHQEYFIETTFMGHKEFSEAYKVGNNNYKKYFPDGGHYPKNRSDCIVIDIEEMRIKGVNPLRY